MKLVVQRVKKAQVKIEKENKIVGKIGKGLLVLIGVGENDSESTALQMAEKICKLRVMADKNGKMNLSITDCRASVLVVSQFTLYADTSAGNRPSFVDAAKPQKALDIYMAFIEKLKQEKIEVQTGSFGEYMEIEAVLDGPVTIIY